MTQLTLADRESCDKAMPWSERLDAPGVLHHFKVRGIERRDIFQGDTGREDFLGRLAKLLPATQTACYAWAVRDLGLALTELARRLGLSPSGVSDAVQRGETLVRENHHKLVT